MPSPGQEQQQQQQQQPRRPSQQQQEKAAKVPDFEKDINTLIDTFHSQVQSGHPCNLGTFKAVWSSLSFSFIHQATPSVLNAADHLQLLYSSALNRVDTFFPGRGRWARGGARWGAAQWVAAGGEGWDGEGADEWPHVDGQVNEGGGPSSSAHHHRRHNNHHTHHHHHHHTHGYGPPGELPDGAAGGPGSFSADPLDEYEQQLEDLFAMLDEHAPLQDNLQGQQALMGHVQQHVSVGHQQQQALMGHGQQHVSVGQQQQQALMGYGQQHVSVGHQQQQALMGHGQQHVLAGHGQRHAQMGPGHQHALAVQSPAGQALHAQGPGHTGGAHPHPHHHPQHQLQALQQQQNEQETHGAHTHADAAQPGAAPAAASNEHQPQAVQHPMQQVPRSAQLGQHLAQQATQPGQHLMQAASGHQAGPATDPPAPLVGPGPGSSDLLGLELMSGFGGPACTAYQTHEACAILGMLGDNIPAEPVPAAIPGTLPGTLSNTLPGAGSVPEASAGVLTTAGLLGPGAVGGPAAAVDPDVGTSGGQGVVPGSGAEPGPGVAAHSPQPHRPRSGLAAGMLAAAHAALPTLPTPSTPTPGINVEAPAAHTLTPSAAGAEFGQAGGLSWGASPSVGAVSTGQGHSVALLEAFGHGTGKTHMPIAEEEQRGAAIRAAHMPGEAGSQADVAAEARLGTSVHAAHRPERVGAHPGAATGAHLPLTEGRPGAAVHAVYRPDEVGQPPGAAAEDGTPTAMQASPSNALQAYAAGMDIAYMAAPQGTDSTHMAVVPLAHPGGTFEAPAAPAPAYAANAQGVGAAHVAGAPLAHPGSAYHTPAVSGYAAGAQGIDLATQHNWNGGVPWQMLPAPEGGYPLTWDLGASGYAQDPSSAYAAHPGGAIAGQPHAALHHVAPPGPATLQLPPLAVRIGAIYALYCLYHTQTQRPRCRIYLPLLLLKLLTAMIPEMLAEGAIDAVRALQLLWSHGAFLIGATRRPASFAPHQAAMGVSTGGGRRALPYSDTLSVSSNLLEDRVTRDALFHLRSDLRSLVEYRRLGQAVSDYHSARESIFAAPNNKTRKSNAAGAGAGSSGRGMHNMPPVLFPSSCAVDLQQLIEGEAKRVQLSLLPDSRPLLQRAAAVKRGEAVATTRPAERGGLARVNAARRARRRARRVGVVAADIPAAAPGEEQQQGQDVDEELQEVAELEAELQGLRGAAAAAVARKQARQRECTHVQSLWLSAYEQLAQEEDQEQEGEEDEEEGVREGQAGRAGEGAGEGLGLGVGMDADGDVTHEEMACNGLGHAEDAALAAELDVEFGQVLEDEEEAEEEEEAGEAGAAPDSQGASDAQHGAASAAAPAQPPPPCVPVWCNAKPGLLTGLTGPAASFIIACFCASCQQAAARDEEEEEGQEGGPGVASASGSFAPAAFMQHCGLKGIKWRQSIFVDEQFLPEAVMRYKRNPAGVRGLMARRQPVRKGGKKLGEWLQQALPQGASKKAAAGKKRRRDGDVADASGQAGDDGDAAEAVAPQGAPAPVVAASPAAPPAPQVADEYADLLAQFEGFSQVMQSVQALTSRPDRSP